MKILALHPEKCTGCLRCELACSYMQTGTFQPSKSVIRVSPLEGYTSYAPYTCTQCAEGWCMTACPVGRHPDQCRGGQGRDRRQVRGVQALHHRLPLRHHVLRPRFRARPTSATSAAARRPAPRCARPQAITYEEAETADWIGDFAAERTAYVLKMERRRLRRHSRGTA